MNILSISDSQTDSGISLYYNNKLIFAVSEERFNRIKTAGGWPNKSLEHIMTKYGNLLNKIDLILFPGIMTPPTLVRIFRKIQKMKYNEKEQKADKFTECILDLIEYKLALKYVKPQSILGKILKIFVPIILRRQLNSSLKRKKIILIDHHYSHATAAFFCSSFKEALIVSFDGAGDGYSAKIYKGRNNNLRQLYSINAYNSLGEFYAMTTKFLGFKAHKHEGKVMGLAAYGNWKNVKEKFPFTVNEDNYKLKCHTKFGSIGLKYLKKYVSQYKKEDIAAWVQHHTEETVSKIIKYFLIKTKMKNLCLVGGLFANVKINQRLHELKEVKSIYIFPAMGDQGLSIGAIYAIIKRNQKFQNIYLGPEYSDKEIEGSLRKYKMKFKKYENIEKIIARLLSQEKIIGRFNGRMEFGPRALGNRSILVSAKNRSINKKLNEILKRTEFMPFAPTVLKEYAHKYIKNLKGAELTSKFMNISFNVTELMKKECSAAVHVDNTARPQVLSKQDNKSFYKILLEYYKLNKVPVIINTSFNIHEEPIVMTPEDAIKGFIQAKLDYLAIGQYLVKEQ